MSEEIKFNLMAMPTKTPTKTQTPTRTKPASSNYNTLRTNVCLTLPKFTSSKGTARYMIETKYPNVFIRKSDGTSYGVSFTYNPNGNDISINDPSLKRGIWECNVDKTIYVRELKSGILELAAYTISFVNNVKRYLTLKYGFVEKLVADNVTGQTRIDLSSWNINMDATTYSGYTNVSSGLRPFALGVCKNLPPLVSPTPTNTPTRTRTQTPSKTGLPPAPSPSPTPTRAPLSSQTPTPTVSLSKTPQPSKTPTQTGTRPPAPTPTPTPTKPGLGKFYCVDVSPWQNTYYKGRPSRDTFRKGILTSTVTSYGSLGLGGGGSRTWTISQPALISDSHNTGFCILFDSTSSTSSYYLYYVLYKDEPTINKDGEFELIQKPGSFKTLLASSNNTKNGIFNSDWAYAVNNIVYRKKQLVLTGGSCRYNTSEEASLVFPTPTPSPTENFEINVASVINNLAINQSVILENSDYITDTQLNFTNGVLTSFKTLSGDIVMYDSLNPYSTTSTPTPTPTVTPTYTSTPTTTPTRTKTGTPAPTGTGL